MYMVVKGDVKLSSSLYPKFAGKSWVDGDASEQHSPHTHTHPLEGPIAPSQHTEGHRRV